jgi:hypothetical protein
MYTFETILAHFPTTATSHEGTKSYLVKWEGYKTHPSHRVFAGQLLEDVPEHVRAYSEDLAEEEPPAA